MKVLFIGHYREGTGWAEGAINYILALDAAGVDVVCRPVKLNNANPQLPERILELESKSSAGSTHCIQNVLPHLMDYNGRFKKNVGLYHAETNSVKYSGWPQRLKTLDEVWVPNVSMISVNEKAGVPKEKTAVVPIPCNLEKYKREYKEFPLPKYMKDSMVFYFIGENILRKRISGLLKAYFTAFDKNDNVVLIIKTSRPGVSSQDLGRQMQEFADNIKSHLNLYSNPTYYPPVMFVTNRLSEDDLYSLHSTGHCFATATHGDAWSIPCFDAMGFGNECLSTDCGGMRDFLKPYSRGTLVPARKTSVFGNERIFNDLQVGHEKWWDVDLCKFGALMKLLYIAHQDNVDQTLCSFDRTHIDSYSYENIGKVMKEYLCS